MDYRVLAGGGIGLLLLAIVGAVGAGSLDSPTGNFFAPSETGEISDWSEAPDRTQFVASVKDVDVSEIDSDETIDILDSVDTSIARGDVVEFKNNGKNQMRLFFSKDILGLNSGSGQLDFVELSPNESQKVRLRASTEYYTQSPESEIQVASGSVDVSEPVNYEFVEEGLVDYWTFDGNNPLKGINGRTLDGYDIAEGEGIVGSGSVKFVSEYGGNIDYNGNNNFFSGLALDGNETLNFWVKPEQGANRDRYDQRFEIGDMYMREFYVRDGNESFQYDFSSGNGNYNGEADLVDEGEKSYISLQREHRTVDVGMDRDVSNLSNLFNASSNVTVDEDITMNSVSTQAVADLAPENQTKWDNKIYESDVTITVEKTENQTVEFRSMFGSQQLENGTNEITASLSTYDDPRLVLNSSSVDSPTVKSVDIEQTERSDEIIRILRDGEVVFEDTRQNANPTLNSRFGIQFNSAIVDEVSFYNQILTPEEIQTNMEVGDNEGPQFSLFSIFS